MTVIGFDGEHRDQPDQAGVVRDDADDVGPAGDLAVQALKRVVYKHAAGIEAAVVGVPDDELGEDVGPAVALTAGAANQPQEPS